MNRLCRILLLLVGMLCAPTALFAHGGVYIGPGDVVPPEGTGAKPATPPTPAEPTGPSTPENPPVPTTPERPRGPITPPNPPANGAKPTTDGGAAIGADLTTWVFWWEFNKDRFLNLRSKVGEGHVETNAAGPLAGLGGGAGRLPNLLPTQRQKRDLIVPRLFQLLDEEDDRDIATAAMIALAKVGFRIEDSLEVFTKHLDAPIQEVTETAALSFGILKDPRAIPILESLLHDDKDGRKHTGSSEVPVRTRTFAVYSLAMIGQDTNNAELKRRIGEILYSTLIEDQSAVKDIRVACVIGIGVLDLQQPEDMILHLGAILKEDEMSALVLAHIPNAMAKLMRKLPSAHPTRDSTIDQLLAILERRSKRSAYIKMSAVQSLGMLAVPDDPRNQEIFDSLARQRKQARQLQVKNFTAISMAYLGVADPKMRDQVTKYLVDHMKKSSTGYRPWCGLALGVMAFRIEQQGETLPAPVMERTLAKFEDTGSPEEKGAYAIALGLMRYQEAKAPILKALEKSRETQFRGYASIALGLLDAREYRDNLHRIVLESKRDPDLLKQTSIGLGLMKDRNALEYLLGYLQPDGGRRPHLAVLASVASALGLIGDKASVRPLVDTLGNDRLTPLGRAFAAVALGMVAGKDYLPWNSTFSADLNYRASVSTLVDQATGTGILDIR